jgi:general secretion pathway protein B
MSYILDALRKSERERQAGQVPGLPNLVSDGDKKSARWLFWLVGLLLLINLGGVAYWLFLRPASQQERLQTPVTPPPVTPVNSAELSPAAKADQAVTTSVANAGVSPQGQPSGVMAVPVPASPASAQPLVQPAIPVIPAVPSAPQAVPSGVAPGSVLPPPAVVASVPGQPPTPVQAQTQPQLQSQTPLAPAVPAPTTRELPYFPPEHSSTSRHSVARVPSAQEQDFDEVDAEMEADDERVADARTDNSQSQPSAVRHGIRAGTPHLRDLPVEFQEKVPPFKITMFAYSKNPGERFVIIDMKKSRVGDRLPGGMLLLEIQSENLVLELDGQKFMIPRY